MGFKIDLHIHTAERSPCAHASAVEMVTAAVACGLDALVITDHNRLTPASELAALNAQCAPFRVYGGIEVHVEAEPLLVIGMDDPALEYTLWTYAGLHAFVRARAGFLALAHPFRFHGVSRNLVRRPPDAIEIHSRNTPPTAAAQIRALASRLGLALLSNSDAHAPEELGRHYNVLPYLPADEAALAALLRTGASCPVLAAHPRL